MDARMEGIMIIILMVIAKLLGMYLLAEIMNKE